MEVTPPERVEVTPIVREFLARSRTSRAVFERAKKSMPGGETRSITYYRPYPIAIRSGRGAVLRDVDGNEYVDVLNNYTSLVHGHAFQPVIDAIAEATRDGTVHPAPHQRQVELAELLCGRYPAVEAVRFTNSGSEAAGLALRIARRVTGRRRVVLFEGAYHGTTAEFIEDGPDIVRVPYNHGEALASALDERVAAVFVEPFLGSAGVIPADPAFLEQVEREVRAIGGLFVLDEVQALRNAEHGIHGSLGLTPDLVLMGKIIGGGLPVGAVGGRAEIMRVTAADRPDHLAHAGTFNGNVLTMAAGHASLRDLDVAAIERLNADAAMLAERIEDSARRAGMAASVTRSGSILHVHLLDRPPTDALGAAAAPAEAVAALHLALLLEGVYAAPHGMLNLSTALGQAELATVAGAYERAFARVRDAISVPVGSR